MDHDLESIHRSLRNGARLSFVLFALIFLPLVGYWVFRAMTDYATRPVSTSLFGLFLFWIGYSWVSRARRMLTIRLTEAGLSVGRGENETTISWADVRRIAFNDRMVRLDLHQGDPIVLDLFFANNPHLVREGVVRRLPVAALRGPDT